MTEFKITRTTDKVIITWPTSPVPQKIWIKFKQYFTNTPNYGPVDAEGLAQIGRFATYLNKKYESNTTIGQVLSMRNLIIKNKIIKNYDRMNKQITEISKKYAKTDILTLARIYDFPPYNLLRGILIALGNDASSVYKIFNKKEAKVNLGSRDRKQFELAQAHDAESTFNQHVIAIRAQKNEDTLVDFLRAQGIKLKTQNELTEIQVQKYGRAMITPDVLFIEPVEINGVICHWIDYKDYIGTHINFIYSSNANQAARYTNKWGPGAIVFHHSFVSGVALDEVTLLDARVLPVKFE